MTRNEMEQCRSLPMEIKAIEASMKSPKSNYVVVFYKDYRTGKGIPKAKQEVDNGEEELKILKAYHRRLVNKLKKRLDAAEKFIASIEDSEMRTILRMYYINGNSQQEIGDAIHYSQAAVSTKLNIFWSRVQHAQAKAKRIDKSDKNNK